jgi:hypothetical protein
MMRPLASLALLVTITVASDYVGSFDGANSTSTSLTGGTTRTGGKSGGRGLPGRGLPGGSGSTGGATRGGVVVGRGAGH